MNILPIKEAAAQLVHALDEAEGEITSEVTDLFRQLENKGMAAIAPLCDVKDELEARMEARKAKARELTELAKKDEAMIANAKKYILAIMQALGQDKFTVGSLSVTVSKGRESIEITDEKAVPLRHKTATIKVSADQLESIEAVFGNEFKGEPKIDVDKTSIKAATTQDMGVAGTQVVRTPYLIIKG